MRISALASGSSGNCFYAENGNSAVLVDAGISCRQIVERMAGLGLNPGNVKAVFITHEHSDHVRGASVFSKEFDVPVFATQKTSENCFLPDDTCLIKNDETIKIGNMEISAFSKSHSAADPVSYNILSGKKISILTDLGTCDNISEHVSGSNLLCLESNHDLGMLENGPYPAFLKKWIRSDSGHLSNIQAGLFALENGSSRLKNIVLSHLSRTNNSPEIALKTFRSLIKERSNFQPRVLVSERELATELIRV